MLAAPQSMSNSISNLDPHGQLTSKKSLLQSKIIILLSHSALQSGHSLIIISSNSAGIFIFLLLAFFLMYFDTFCTKFLAAILAFTHNFIPTNMPYFNNCYFIFLCHLISHYILDPPRAKDLFS